VPVQRGGGLSPAYRPLQLSITNSLPQNVTSSPLQLSRRTPPAAAETEWAVSSGYHRLHFAAPGRAVKLNL
ncbi:hypothetical protein Bpfe_020276, partial [Biomphalaria pfeifferi]